MKYLLVFVLLCGSVNVHAQQIGSLPPFTKWYQNPLGVYPLNLHTSHAIILPTLLAATTLVITKKDSALHSRLSYFTDAGYYKGYFADKTNVWHQNAGITYNLRKWLAFGVEFTTYYFHDVHNNTPGIGVRPFFRFYPVNKSTFKCYFETGAGLLYTFREFPQPSGFWGDTRMGTHINGTPKYGIGIEVKAAKKIMLTAGVRHIHLSNGNVLGTERNPAHDSNGGYIGVSYCK